MRTTLSDHKNFTKTIRQVLPYHFQLTHNGKMAITTTKNDHVLVVSRGQVEGILLRDDLDVHRRKMYEACMEEFNKKAVQ